MAFIQSGFVHVFACDKVLEEGAGVISNLKAIIWMLYYKLSSILHGITEQKYTHSTENQSMRNSKWHRETLKVSNSNKIGSNIPLITFPNYIMIIPCFLKDKNKTQTKQTLRFCLSFYPVPVLPVQKKTTSESLFVWFYIHVFTKCIRKTNTSSILQKMQESIPHCLLQTALTKSYKQQLTKARWTKFPLAVLITTSGLVN